MSLEFPESPRNSYKSHGKMRLGSNGCWTKFLNIFGMAKK